MERSVASLVNNLLTLSLYIFPLPSTTGSKRLRVEEDDPHTHISPAQSLDGEHPGLASLGDGALDPGEARRMLP